MIEWFPSLRTSLMEEILGIHECGPHLSSAVNQTLSSEAYTMGASVGQGVS